MSITTITIQSCKINSFCRRLYDNYLGSEVILILDFLNSEHPTKYLKRLNYYHGITRPPVTFSHQHCFTYKVTTRDCMHGQTWYTKHCNGVTVDVPVTLTTGVGRTDPTQLNRCISEHCSYHI